MFFLDRAIFDLLKSKVIMEKNSKIKFAQAKKHKLTFRGKYYLLKVNV